MYIKLENVQEKLKGKFVPNQSAEMNIEISLEKKNNDQKLCKILWRKVLVSS